VQLVNNSFSSTQRAPENTPLALNDDRVTYRASLNWRPTSDLMVFANYSTGFKSGGFSSGGGVPALGQRRIFNRETVENYEFGVRSEWLDRSLTANLTLYRMDISGYQDRSFDGVSFIVRNAGELRHQGIELDMRLRPSRRLFHRPPRHKPQASARRDRRRDGA
jgi:iron complex outermembrane receptor protein